MPGRPRTWPGTGGRTAGAVPTLPERSRTRTTTMYVPGGAGAPSTWPSQTPRRLPLRPTKRATTLAGSTSVRRTWKRGARRRPTPRARISKLPGVGPAIGGVTESTTGVGAARVDHERAGDRDGAAGAPGADLHAVEAVGSARAGVGPAVPHHGHVALRARVDAGGQAADALAVAVDDRDRHLVGLLDLEADPVDVAAPVAVGREEALELGVLSDGVGALEALGDEEGAERRRDQQREDDAGERAHLGLLRGPCRCRPRRRCRRSPRPAPASRRPSCGARRC